MRQRSDRSGRQSATPADCSTAVRGNERSPDLSSDECRRTRLLSVTHQRTSRLAINHHLSEGDPVLMTIRQQAYMGLVEPLTHNLGCFRGREPLPRESWICHHPMKAATVCHGSPTGAPSETESTYSSQSPALVCFFESTSYAHKRTLALRTITGAPYLPVLRSNPPRCHR